MERCSPRSVPFPPQPPPKVALLCSAGSSVLRHSPTAPERSRPRSVYGLRGPVLLCKPRRPGALSVLVHVVSQRARFSDYAGPNNHSRLAWLSCCLPPLGMESASCTNGFSKLNSPAHRYLCLRFKPHLAMRPTRLEARMDSLLSFPVGLFHPLQHAGLSRRSPSCRLSARSVLFEVKSRL